MARRLRRSRKHRIIAGVCGGIAERIGWTPTSVRFVYVLLSLFPVLPGILVYLILWILIPSES